MKKRVYLIRNITQVFFLYVLLCLLLFTNMNCKKDKLPINQLPAATQKGAGTFGCLANGIAITPTIELFSYSNRFSYGYTPDYGFGVQATNKKNNTLRMVEIDLQIKNLVEGQTYILNEYNIVGKGGAAYDIFYDSGQSDHYETNNQVNGTVTITKLDLGKEIISGVFAFKAINSSNGDVANITDGRFDLKFK